MRAAHSVLEGGDDVAEVDVQEAQEGPQVMAEPWDMWNDKLRRHGGTPAVHAPVYGHGRTLQGDENAERIEALEAEVFRLIARVHKIEGR